MSRYELLVACFRSGQMTIAQFMEHLNTDQLFKAWYRRHG